MAAGEANTAGDLLKRSQLQRVSQQRLSHCVQRCIGSGSTVELQQALVTLLQSRDTYDVRDSSAIAPYEYARVSLPESVHKAQLLVDQLPVANKCLLERFEEEMLRLASEEDALIDLRSMPGCYTDSVLLGLPREYARLVPRCVEFGLAGFTLKGRSRVGIFFARNKKGDSRVILDCGRVDIKFTTLRSVALLTGEGLSHIEVGEIWDGDWDQYDSCPKLDLLACNPHPVSWPALVRSMAASRWYQS